MNTVVVIGGDCQLVNKVDGEADKVIVVGSEPKLQEKIATPTKELQEITPDNGYDGLSKVDVEAIPSEYIVPSGEQTITENGTYDITDKASAVVNVSGGGGSLVETTLWTNPSPASPFQSQTVGLSGSVKDYDFVKIKFREGVSYPDEYSVVFQVEDFYPANTNKAIYIGEANCYSKRGLRFSDDTNIYFDGGSGLNSSGGRNDYCIPIAIYGIKLS